MLDKDNYAMGNETMQDEDKREAWVLRAGAELWKAVVAEAGSPAEDTQKALEAVRNALDCARRLRCAGDIPRETWLKLEAECEQASEMQASALQQWGRGRGMDWGEDWGTQWGETLAPKSRSSDPTESMSQLRQCL